MGIASQAFLLEQTTTTSVLRTSLLSTAMMKLILVAVFLAAASTAVEMDKDTIMDDEWSPHAVYVAELCEKKLRKCMNVGRDNCFVARRLCIRCYSAPTPKKCTDNYSTCIDYVIKKKSNKKNRSFFGNIFEECISNKNACIEKACQL